MKYIWIGMLIAVDATWWIASIADIMSAMKIVKSHRRCSNIGDFIKYVVNELDDSTTYCISLHIAALFFVSMYIYTMDKIDK